MILIRIGMRMREGGSLLANTSAQSLKNHADVPTLSRASSLPQGPGTSRGMGVESRRIIRQLLLYEIQKTLNAQSQLRVAVVHRMNRLAITTVGFRQNDFQTP